MAQEHASQELGREPQALYAGCSPTEDRLATIGAGDVLEVNYALSSGTGTCYRVTLKRAAINDGPAMAGYVLGEKLPAVAAFVKEQEKSRAEFALEQQRELEQNRLEENRLEQSRLEQNRSDEVARSQAASQAAPAHPAAGKLNPDMPAQFEEFGGRDMHGKPVSLSGLGGKVILVTFWSPRSAASKKQLLGVLPLYNRYKGAGLRAVGISTDPNPAHINQALDDITLTWPQIPDRAGLATRYGANAATGTTFVLDASHHILAAGLSPAELENKVRELISAH
jgi:peroxiredoxin